MSQRYKIVTFNSYPFALSKDFHENFEKVLNDCPEGYELRDWQFTPGTSETYARYIVVFERIKEKPMPVLTGRKFKEKDE